MTESPDKPPENPPPPYPYPYPGYPPPAPPHYYGYPPPAAIPRNGIGIASLVLAIVGLLFVWSVAGGVVIGIVAIVLGFVGWARVKRGEANNGGVAIAGIVLGIVAILVGLAFAAIWIALWKDVGGDNYFDCLDRAGSNRIRQQQCADQFRENVQDRLSVTLTPTP
ncbi:DUF4190 domain-containing protein [Mycobacterium branderi]|uniref:DUF4190 domain-containing protein n=1 Tax=Mycobacterium branderi TaxID=43348 RepID=A0A7I7W9X5_9MYCO|nr:DUF4190 domain-containing protein [Mycobacterium branderi]MCV7235764.1 DUF4190 domain-containing protein [Mycobacterium branderi]ORA35156.1 DUF4190 domain-containing protein [Mycobacterium branderi]BBZ13930.1 hypothetical protein MBRA_41250 [Mycobacterium branderi]